MAYDRKFCTQCGERLLFEDVTGKIVSQSPIRREADLVFENGHRVRYVACEMCLNNPNFSTVLESIMTAVGTVPDSTKEYIQSMGMPTNVTEARRS